VLPSALALGPLGGLLRAADAEDRPRRTSEDDRMRRLRRTAIERGCAFLSTKVRDDGAYGEQKAVVALTALTVLALQAGGSTDGRGPHGVLVRRGLNFLLKLLEQPDSGQHRPEGYFHHPHDSDSKMHGQGYASLALATALGAADQNRAQEMRSALAKAVRCMEASQTGTGGYGYDPSPDSNHEGSVTVCVAQALRAARDCGLLVSQSTVTRALGYLHRSQIRKVAPDGSDADDDGGFRYSETHDKHSYALTAAALSSFFLFGKYKDDANRTIERGLRYMLRQLERGEADRDWYYYGHFYGAWACWQKDGGDWSPDSWWGRWARSVIPDMIEEKQQSNGSWDDSGDRYAYGPVLATAFAVLTLAIPDEALPIFQR
jgi:hypothetical protein